MANYPTVVEGQAPTLNLNIYVAMLLEELVSTRRSRLHIWLHLFPAAEAIDRSTRRLDVRGIPKSDGEPSFSPSRRRSWAFELAC